MKIVNKKLWGNHVKVKEEVITDDILQETFIKIHTKLHTLRDLNKLKSWIHSISRNSILDYFKSKNQTFEITNFEPEIEIEYESHSEKDCLRGILSGLPKKHRDPIFLSDIKGMKQAEVARQLNVPLSTAKSQMQRARKLIAEGFFMDCCEFKQNEKSHLVEEIKDKKDYKFCSD